MASEHRIPRSRVHERFGAHHMEKRRRRSFEPRGSFAACEEAGPVML